MVAAGRARRGKIGTEMKSPAQTFAILLLPATVIFSVFDLPSAELPGQVKAQGPACQGEISVDNLDSEIEFRSANTFTITVRNTGDETVTVTVVDELWEDENCSGEADRYGCEGSKLSEPCSWGVTSGGSKRWEDVSLAAGEIKTLTWEKGGFFPGFCYLHNVYFYSTPLDSSNRCWQGFESGWQEARNGNLQFKKNQTRFSVASELLTLEGTAYGGVIHLDFQGSGVGSLARFKDDIDHLSADSQKWRIIRVGAHPWHLVNWATPSSIDWNEESFNELVEAIGYAYGKGFSTIFTTSPWDNKAAWGGGGYDQQKYNDYVNRFFEELALKLKETGVLEKIYLWAPWNEVNNWCFTSYINQGECSQSGGLPPNYRSSDEYVEAFLVALATARDAIQSVDSRARVIPHGGYYRWYLLTEDSFLQHRDNFDGIGLSFYPQQVQHRIGRFDKILDYLRYKYEKPVYVLETGFKSAVVGETGQAAYLVNCFQEADKHATVVGLYKVDDSYNPADPKFEGFGIRRKDGTKKPSYGELTNFVDEHGVALLLWGDLDHDYDVDSDDIKIFLSRYGTDDPEADLSDDGIVNGLDFGEMVKLM